MRLLRRLLVVVLFVAILVAGWQFAARNATPVSVDVLATRSTELPLWTVLALAFLGGVALTTVVALYRLARLGLVTRRYRKTLRGLEAEVHQLRNLPLAADAPDARDAPGRSGGALEGGT